MMTEFNNLKISPPTKVDQLEAIIKDLEGRAQELYQRGQADLDTLPEKQEKHEREEKPKERRAQKIKQTFNEEEFPEI